MLGKLKIGPLKLVAESSEFPFPPCVSVNSVFHEPFLTNPSSSAFSASLR